MERRVWAVVGGRGWVGEREELGGRGVVVVEERERMEGGGRGGVEEAMAQKGHGVVVIDMGREY